MALIRRAAQGNVTITDVTEDYCVIGVMGAASRGILAALLPDDWRDFPFATARDVTISGIACLATRLSYVGELGWELTIANDGAATVFDALIAQGAKPMGHYALNGCRIEKGYRHWGHDLGPEITPLEAGLGFTIDWSKDFRGKAAHAAPRSPLGRRQPAHRSRRAGAGERPGGGPHHLWRERRAQRPHAGARNGQRRARRNAGTDGSAQFRS